MAGKQIAERKRVGALLDRMRLFYEIPSRETARLGGALGAMATDGLFGRHGRQQGQTELINLHFHLGGGNGKLPGQKSTGRGARGPVENQWRRLYCHVHGCRRRRFWSSLGGRLDGAMSLEVKTFGGESSNLLHVQVQPRSGLQLRRG